MALEGQLHWWLWGCSLLHHTPSHHGFKDSSLWPIDRGCSYPLIIQSGMSACATNWAWWKPVMSTLHIPFQKRFETDTWRMSISLSNSCGSYCTRHAKPANSSNGSGWKRETSGLKTSSSIMKAKSKYSTATQWSGESATTKKHLMQLLSLIWLLNNWTNSREV